MIDMNNGITKARARARAPAGPGFGSRALTLVELGSWLAVFCALSMTMLGNKKKPGC